MRACWRRATPTRSRCCRARCRSTSTSSACLKRLVPFTAWYVEVDQMRGLNDGEGFKKGDALIHAAARLLESACEPGVDFVGHVAGSRFVMLMQSDDWRERAERGDRGVRRARRERRSIRTRLARGYFISTSRDGLRHGATAAEARASASCRCCPASSSRATRCSLTAKQASRRRHERSRRAPSTWTSSTATPIRSRCSSTTRTNKGVRVVHSRRRRARARRRLE